MDIDYKIGKFTINDGIALKQLNADKNEVYVAQPKTAWNKVVVNVPIPPSPTGTKIINTKNIVDVSSYANAQVDGEFITQENIKKGITILGVTGTYKGDGGIIPKGTKTLTTLAKTNVYNEEFAIVDATNIVANNIKDGVNILGVTGTYVPEIKLQEKEIVANGNYSPDASFDGFSKVVVNVPKTINLEKGIITTNGVHKAQLGYDGFSEVDVNVISKLQNKTATTNGVYKADSGYDGLGEVNVNVPKNVKLEDKLITANGRYVAGSGFDGLGEVNVKVELGNPPYDVNHYYPLKFYWDDEINNQGSQVVDIYDDNWFEIHLKAGGTEHAYENMNGMFKGCKKITKIPNIDTWNVRDMSGMFDGCYQLSNIPLLDTHNVNNMAYMFKNCSNLDNIPEFDTSQATNMWGTFSGCSNKMRKAPNLNTSNVKYMCYMFDDCRVLSSVPLYNTSQVNTMACMFRFCGLLTNVPEFDTSQVDDMSEMFHGCRSLLSVPLYNTSQVTNMKEMFYGCNGLTEIPAFDCSKVRYFDGFIGNCYNITSIKLKNINANLDIAPCRNIERQAVREVINNLVQQSGGTRKKLTMRKIAFDNLFEEDKQIANNKGWDLVISDIYK